MFWLTSLVVVIIIIIVAYNVCRRKDCVEYKVVVFDQELAKQYCEQGYESLGWYLTCLTDQGHVPLGATIITGKTEDIIQVYFDSKDCTREIVEAFFDKYGIKVIKTKLWHRKKE